MRRIQLPKLFSVAQPGRQIATRGWRFAILTVLFLSPLGALAADGDDDIVDIDSYELEMIDGTFYVHSLNGWNAIADCYNGKTLKIDETSYKIVTNDPDANITGVTCIENSSVKICIDSNIECSQNSNDIIKKINTSFFGELSMKPDCYISGSVTKYNDEGYSAGLLINMNFGAIKGVKIKGLAVSSPIYVNQGICDAVLCGINDGTITDCEVIDSWMIYSMGDSENQEANGEHVVSAICSDNRGTITNCFVKDFQCEIGEYVAMTFDANKVFLNVTQLASANVDSEGTINGEIKNNCVVITNQNLLNKELNAGDYRYTNYPLIIFQKTDNSGSYVAENIDESNRVFVIPTVDLYDGQTAELYNITVGDNFVVRRTEQQDGGDGTKTFYDVQSWDAAVKNFCSQQDNSFRPVVYNYRVNGEEWFFPAAIIVPSVRIDNPTVVTKLYPNFWNDLKISGFGVITG